MFCSVTPGKYGDKAIPCIVSTSNSLLYNDKLFPVAQGDYGNDLIPHTAVTIKFPAQLWQAIIIFPAQLH